MTATGQLDAQFEHVINEKFERTNRNFTFMCPCITNIFPNYTTNDTNRSIHPQLLTLCMCTRIT